MDRYNLLDFIKAHFLYLKFQIKDYFEVFNCYLKDVNISMTLQEVKLAYFDQSVIKLKIPF